MFVHLFLWEERYVSVCVCVWCLYVCMYIDIREQHMHGDQRMVFRSPPGSEVGCFVTVITLQLHLPVQLAHELQHDFPVSVSHLTVRVHWDHRCTLLQPAFCWVQGIQIQVIRCALQALLPTVPAPGLYFTSFQQCWTKKISNTVEAEQLNTSSAQRSKDSLVSDLSVFYSSYFMASTPDLKMGATLQTKPSWSVSWPSDSVLGASFHHHVTN